MLVFYAVQVRGEAKRSAAATTAAANKFFPKFSES
jgi:hypothetical protein